MNCNERKLKTHNLEFGIKNMREQNGKNRSRKKTKEETETRKEEKKTKENEIRVRKKVRKFYFLEKMQWKISFKVNTKLALIPY